jgi:7-carboxy-7-deazaguanine synthase (Cx14CxxC type)
MSRTYSVKEAFYTLQGEGAHAGMPAVFVRFSGCNLWSGRDSDRTRAKGSCAAWCDTDFVGTDGTNGGKYTAQDIADLVLRLWPATKTRPRIVLTGGEPLLQVDSELVGTLLAHRCWLAIETNGTQPVPHGIDWICVSPKAGAPITLTVADELKIVWPQDIDPEAVLAQTAVNHCSIQPRADIPNSTQDALAFVKDHPRWRLSLQLHKLLHIP